MTQDLDESDNSGIWKGKKEIKHYKGKIEKP